MSGDTFNSYGSGHQVVMNGGSGNTGIVTGGRATAAQAAVEALRLELRELRGTLAPDAERTIDGSLPVLADGTRPAAERRAALPAISGAVAALGAAAAPVRDLIEGLRGLLGG
ncbi:hypothetical protein [Streptomyces sp. H51]|uniref:hypothetical protein n=1 Tax=Streptomyces sp. H51 TaxID=3111770 RepID=UPI002D765869|nr:hypothetical protein [Streptomyces sp. H51]